MEDAMRIFIEVEPDDPRKGLVAQADQSTASGRAIQVRIEEEVFLDIEWDKDEETISWSLRTLGDDEPKASGAMIAGYAIKEEEL